MERDVLKRSTVMQRRRRKVDAEIKRAFDNSNGTYGSPRVRAHLRREGTMASKKTVEKSMARQGLCARPQRRYNEYPSANQ